MKKLVCFRGTPLSQTCMFPRAPLCIFASDPPVALSINTNQGENICSFNQFNKIKLVALKLMGRAELTSNLQENFRSYVNFF